MPELQIKSFFCLSAAVCISVTVFWSFSGAFGLRLTPADARGDEALAGFHIPTHASGYLSSCSCDAPKQPSNGGSTGAGDGDFCVYDLASAGKMADAASKSRKLVEGSKHNRSMRVKLKHRDDVSNSSISRKNSFLQALRRDSTRMHSISTRAAAKKQGKMIAAAKNEEKLIAAAKNQEKLIAAAAKNQEKLIAAAKNQDILIAAAKKQGKMIAAADRARDQHRAEGIAMEKSLALESTVESGASLGAGEYFVDFYLGSPPRHFSLIIDTGSDLTWVQCSPCEYCYEQEGPLYDPKTSSSYDPVSCAASECQLVHPPAQNYCNPQKPQSCSYLYWYGDNSNTSGILATETVTIAATNTTTLQIKSVIFGCGTANRGLFQGAGGLLGLGQGPLSFSSQLKSLLGYKFSYCLVDRNQNLSVSSTLIFGEDDSVSSHPDVQYIPFAENIKAMDSTFYYVRVVGVLVGGETLPIPAATWEIDEHGYGGTIFDSGTTLTYLAQPAYQIIKAAFESRISYPKATAMPDVLDLCYNLTHVSDPRFPELGIVFEKDTLMSLATPNYFVQPDPDEKVLCLAIQEAKNSHLSIIGNLQQQNFHILYDRENSRIGFAPMICASL